MSKRVIGWLSFISIICIIAFGVYVYWDYKNVILINEEYVYSEDSIFVINEKGDYQSIWMKLQSDNFAIQGSSIWAVDSKGTMTECLRFKDSSINDLYQSNENLYVVYYYTGDFKGGTSEICRVAKCSLVDIENYTVIEYPSGEIVGFNYEKETMILKSELEIDKGLRSNVVFYDSAIFYLDDTQLISMGNEGKEVIYYFQDEINYAEIVIAKDTLYVVYGDGYTTSKIMAINLETQLDVLCYETASDVIDICVIEDDLYVLFPASVMCIHKDGTAKNIMSLETEGNKPLRALHNNGQNLIMFSDEGIYKVISID